MVKKRKAPQVVRLKSLKRNKKQKENNIKPNWNREFKKNNKNNKK